MAKVLGVGGVFFKTPDPPGLADWYRRVLGLEVEAWGGAALKWPDRGQFVWAPFAADTDYFGPSDSPFMLTFIVADLDGVLARAAEAGVDSLDRSDSDPNGRFAWIVDPTGLKIELWEPREPDSGEAK
jgi:catechol 2,3-dioxygenase-like lactoylglutathione lyase family enzyme